MNIKDSYLQSGTGVIKALKWENGLLKYQLADVNNSNWTSVGTIPTWNQNTTGQAKNISGGAALKILYQSAVNTTAFINAPTATSFLKATKSGTTITFGWDTNNYAGSSSAGGNATKADSITTEAATGNSSRGVFFAYEGNNSKVVYNDNFTYNPSTNVLTVGSISGALSGNATTASNLTGDMKGFLYQSGTSTTTGMALPTQGTTNYIPYMNYNSSKVQTTGWISISVTSIGTMAAKTATNYGIGAGYVKIDGTTKYYLQGESTARYGLVFRNGANGATTYSTPAASTANQIPVITTGANGAYSSATWKKLSTSISSSSADTEIPTALAVYTAINSGIRANDAMKFMGTLGTDGTITALPASHAVGDTYRAIAGAPNVSSKALEVGDLVICVAAGTTASDNDWVVVQANLDGAVIGPSSSTSGHIPSFSDTTGKLLADTYSVKTLTSVSASGWTNNTTDNKILPSMSFIAYWNGAYSGNSSNLAYCNKGAFGSIITKSVDDYVHVTGDDMTGALKITTTTVPQLKLSSSDSAAGNNVDLQLWRGTNASWSIINTSGELQFRNNYTTQVQSTWTPALVLTYNTGNASFKSTTEATSSTVGAATFAGGVGIAKKLYVGSSIYASTTLSVGTTTELKGAVTLGNVNGNAGSLIFYQANKTKITTISAKNATTGANYNQSLPAATGWIAVGGNGSSTGVGSTSQPVYLSTSGVLTACTMANLSVGNATNAANVATISRSSTAEHYLVFVDSNNSSSTNELLYTSANIKFTPNTGSLTTSGDITCSDLYATGNDLFLCSNTTTSSNRCNLHYDNSAKCVKFIFN